MNYLCIVGRIIEKPILNNDFEKGQKDTILKIAVNRNYKNDEGIYETDFFDVLLLNNIAESTCEYCEKGDIIGIKGRLENRYTEDRRKYDIIVAEKVTFLSASRE